MAYLETMNIDNFIVELKDNKVKEARFAILFATVPDQNVGYVTQCRIHLTALVDKTVYRMTEFTAIFPTNAKDEQEKALKATGEREEAIKKLMVKEKISLKAGEWKE